MRLINCKTLELEEFIGSFPPEYAILSHTWGQEEVLFSDLPLHQASTAKKAGYRKIKFTCNQALCDGLQYAWVDTCCIDKTSSAELSEAINSMFNWYARSYRCYAFLEDVSAIDLEGNLAKSRWFTRGWTLQELLAPTMVVFYDAAWTTFGTRESLARTIARITRIDSVVLVAGVLPRWGYGNKFHSLCIAKKMSWAAYRETTRKEDEAYCLMGIFGINMPLLYGEGGRAFIRLQEEIIKKKNSDDSILAWNLDAEESLSSVCEPASEHVLPMPKITGQMLASSPLEFKNCVDLELAQVRGPLLTLDGAGISTRLPLVSMYVNTEPQRTEKLLVGLLSCSLRARKSSHMLGILLSPQDWNRHPAFPRHVVRRSRSIPFRTISRTVLVNSRDALASTDFEQITIVPYIQQHPAGSTLYNKSYLINETTNIKMVGLCLVHVEGWYGIEHPQFGGQMLQKADRRNWQADCRTYTRLWNDPPIHVLSLSYAFCSQSHHAFCRAHVAFIVHLEMSLNLAIVYTPTGPTTEHDMKKIWGALRVRRWHANADRMTYIPSVGRRIQMFVSLTEKRTIHDWRIFSVEVNAINAGDKDEEYQDGDVTMSG